MSSSLDTLVQELSKQLDDNWRSIAVTNTTNPTYTVKDTALSEKQADWVTDGTGSAVASTVYIVTALRGSPLASAAPEGEERVVNALTPSTSLLTTTTLYPFTAAVANTDIYEVHRLFTRAEKERAIQYGCYATFPAVYKQISAYTRHSWIKDSTFYKWTTTTNPTYWNVDTVTATQTTANPNIWFPGSSSCALSAATGFISQRITEYEQLAYLQNTSITFKARIKASTASQIKLAVWDGTTLTSGDYHAGGGDWSDPDDLDVTASIPDAPSEVEFRIYYDSLATTAYVAEAWTTGGGGQKSLDVSPYGLFQNRPSQIHKITDEDYPEGTFTLVHNWESPTSDALVRFRSSVTEGALLRILGMGFLTQPENADLIKATAAISTEADAPQIQIIVAEAAVYLYDLLIARSPFQDITRGEAIKARWENLAARRRIQFNMPQPAGTIHY